MSETGTAAYLSQLCRKYLRPVLVTDIDGAGIVFNPPLTPAEQAIFDDLKLMVKFGVDMTLAEWQSVKPDAQLLKTYAGIASPTLVQTVAAVKAQSRILAVIIRS